MTGRVYLWVLSLQFFVIDHGTMTGRGYLLVLSLQIFVINHGTMSGRGYLWILSMNYDWKSLFVGTLPAIFCH